ncbi:MAG: hypothetical protein KME22_08960 [Hassallia sp. WJT32-NPBG1]|jgi:hypothetical protein|nr:hypothetical protein [Hassallia sp. WJT32-NPBG1]
MNINRFWRKHNSKIVFGSLVIASLIYSSNDISANMRSLSEARQVIGANTRQLTLLEEQLNHEKAQAKIAEARYKAGCAIVVAVNSPRNLATLVEGETVLDRTSKKSLPVGTVVCDSNGNTGVLISNKSGVPVVSQMAFTGNRELAIAQIRRIHGAKLYFVTPEK